MKRSILVLSLALALSFVFVGSAFANFGPHGGYATDTDSCAACHRAHSSFSSIKFTPQTPGPNPADYPYALLVGNAATIQEFCDACHGDLAPGAATNVQSGRFDSGPSGAAGQAAGTTGSSVPGAGQDAAAQVVQYETDSTFNAPLNGGGFGSIIAGQQNKILDTADYQASSAHNYKAVSSAHSMEAVGTLWGAGSASTTSMNLTCTNCHDPHGSSNYRLLRDGVNNSADSGSYVGDSPQAAVFSNETGYPYADGGWLLHTPGAAQMAAYRPNYTSGSSQIRAATLGGNGSLSTWCSGCHTEYDKNSSSYDYSATATGPNPDAGPSGALTRHRHPVDIPVSAGDHILQTYAADDGSGGTDPGGLRIDTRIPLEINPNLAGQRNGANLGCLTCHFAHGTTATMSGWANAHLVQNANGTWVPQRDARMGVDPNKVVDPMAALNTFSDQFTHNAVAAGTSDLLRADNRGVCERCHNK